MKYHDEHCSDALIQWEWCSASQNIDLQRDPGQELDQAKAHSLELAASRHNQTSSARIEAPGSDLKTGLP
jgi:hypothetical protein